MIEWYIWVGPLRKILHRVVCLCIGHLPTPRGSFVSHDGYRIAVYVCANCHAQGRRYSHV